MESSHKKILSACAIVLLGIGLTAKAAAVPEVTAVMAQEETISTLMLEKETEPVVFWYTGTVNQAFFEMCADDFRKETGIAVTLAEQPSLNYFSGIYEAVKNEEEAPDVYLLEADMLEQAYFSQLLEENVYAESFQEDFAQNALNAAACEGKMYGYPLYFNTCIFAYREDYFETPPNTVQEMIDYSVEHDPGEGVEKLLEWDLSDGFYNFPFFGTSVVWEETEPGCIRYSWEEDSYEACKTFFGNLTATIELDENEISREKVVGDFQNGKTVAVFIDSDDLEKVCKENCRVAGLPGLNEELPMIGAAKTMLLCVNGMADDKDTAAKFAEYVTTQKAESLSEMTGHVSVKESALVTEEQKTAWKQYGKSLAEPDAINATDFWVKFQNEVLEIWNEAE